MKICFITEYDPSTPNARSGVPFYIAKAIREAGMDLEILQVSDRRNIWQRIGSRTKQWLCRTGLWGEGVFYDAGYSVATAKSYRRCWKNFDFSVYEKVISISPRTVAFLPQGISPILWIDNTLATFSTYPGMEGICRTSLKEGKMVEQVAFARAAKIFTASGWLKKELSHQFPGTLDKVFVMPRGANLPIWPEDEKVAQLLEQKMELKVLHLFHMVSGWWLTDRKGSQMVIEVFRLLKQKIPVRLTIAGNIPKPDAIALSSEGITCVGRVFKETAEGWEIYQNIVGNAHFMFVPSKAEGFGIVFAEAAALGVPSLALSVMGVTEAVQQGTTGWLLPAGSSACEWAALICEKWQDKIGYREVSESARGWATRYFQWNQNVKSILEGDSLDGYPYAWERDLKAC